MAVLGLSIFCIGRGHRMHLAAGIFLGCTEVIQCEKCGIRCSAASPVVHCILNFWVLKPTFSSRWTLQVTFVPIRFCPFILLIVNHCKNSKNLFVLFYLFNQEKVRQNNFFLLEFSSQERSVQLHKLAAQR